MLYCRDEDYAFAVKLRVLQNWQELYHIPTVKFKWKFLRKLEECKLKTNFRSQIFSVSSLENLIFIWSNTFLEIFDKPFAKMFQSTLDMC